MAIKDALKKSDPVLSSLSRTSRSRPRSSTWATSWATSTPPRQDRGHGGAQRHQSIKAKVPWARCSATLPTSAPRPRAARATPCSSSVPELFCPEERRHQLNDRRDYGGTKVSSQKIAPQGYDHEVVDQSAKLIVDTAQKTGARVSPHPPADRSATCVSSARRRRTQRRVRAHPQGHFDHEVSTAGDIEIREAHRRYSRRLPGCPRLAAPRRLHAKVVAQRRLSVQHANGGLTRSSADGEANLKCLFLGHGRLQPGEQFEMRTHKRLIDILECVPTPWELLPLTFLTRSCVLTERFMDQAVDPRSRSSSKFLRASPQSDVPGQPREALGTPRACCVPRVLRRCESF